MIRIIDKASGALAYEIPDGAEVIPRESEIEIVGDFIIGHLGQNTAIIFMTDAEYSQFVIGLLKEGVQKRLDDFAATRQYNSILSACTYATSSVAQFAAEGQYCVQARDATWGYLAQELAKVDAGTRPMPESYEALEPELPVLEWPS